MGRLNIGVATAAGRQTASPLCSAIVIQKQRQENAVRLKSQISQVFGGNQTVLVKAAISAFCVWTDDVPVPSSINC